MRLKSFQRVMWLIVCMLCVVPFAAHADGPTPQTSDEHFAEGGKYYQLRDWDKAIFHYGESIKMHAENAPAYLMRGTTYINKKDYTSALMDLNKAIALNQDEYLAYLRRSELYNHQEKKELAEADKKEANRRFQGRAAPRTAEDYYVRGMYFEDRGYFGNAISDYGEAIKLDANLKEGYPFTSVYEKRGDLYKRDKKYTEANDDYSRAIAAQPTNVTVLIKRADLNSYYIGDITAAYRDYSSVIARAADLKWAPEKLQHAYEERAFLYEENSEFDKAIADYTELLKLYPQNPHYFFWRGELQNDKREYEKAIRDFDQAILLDPLHENYYNSRGVSYHNLGVFDKAIADYSKAIELFPRYFWPHYNRGLIYDKQRDWPKAEADFSAALELSPKDTNSLNNRAVAYVQQKLWDKALVDLNLAIELDAKNANSYNTRGVVYHNQGEADKAIADFTQAVTLVPNFILAYSNRAKTYRQQKKIAEAEADEKKVKELSR